MRCAASCNRGVPYYLIPFNSWVRSGLCLCTAGVPPSPPPPPPVLPLLPLRRVTTLRREDALHLCSGQKHIGPTNSPQAETSKRAFAVNSAFIFVFHYIISLCNDVTLVNKQPCIVSTAKENRCLHTPTHCILITDSPTQLSL